MAEALYRKYRPQVFEDVVGQEPIERTLKNAIAQGKVSHAYLFTGPRGTGKTTTARLLAKALLCQAGPTPDPDGTCEDCQLIADGVHPDVYELDAASRTGVENVREEIISRVSFAPTRGRNKVYIIDEVHMLSTAAFNALLKTLEEPPDHVVFVLCTTDPQKVPETIHSRCQRFDFRRIAPEAMVSRLGAICISEDVEFEGEALDLIAHRAEGGLRNALTSLEQIIAFENGRVTLAGAERLLGSIDSNDMAEIIAYVGKRDVANCFRWTAAYVETGADLAQFVRDMAEHVRNLYIMALVGEDVELDVGETSRHELTGELQWFGPDRLARLLGVLGDLTAELKTSSNPRLAFEIALTRMVRPDSDLTLEALAERVEALEGGYSAVAHVLPGQPLAQGTQGAGGLAGGDNAAVQASAQAATVQAATPAQTAPQAATQTQTAQAPQTQQAAQPAIEASAPASSTSSQGAPAIATQQAPTSLAPEAAVSPSDATPPASATSPAADDKLAALQNPAALQRIWQAALSALKKQKQSHGVLFMNTKAQYDAQRGVVKVVFPAESTFVFTAAQKPDVQDALAAALQQALGQPFPFAFEQAGGVVVQPAMQQPAAETVAASVLSAPAESPAPGSATQVAPAPGPATASKAAFALAAAPMSDAAPETAAAPAPGPAPEPAPAYDAVPHDEAPYEEVPYEDIDAGAFAPAPDANTSASPGEPNLTPQGAIAEDPSDVEALLQAGFGGGVVFSEVEE